MIAAVAMLVAGLAAPYALRAAFGDGDLPRSAIATQLTGLLLAWAGALGVVAEFVAPHGAGVWEVCRALFAALWEGRSTVSGVGALTVVLLLHGRGLVAGVRTGRSIGRARRDFLARGDRDGDVVLVAGLGSPAVTAGLLRSVVAVDRDFFAAMAPTDRLVVVAHERAHQRGLHPVVDLVAGSLAAGLWPWPGATVARAEVRRHLEAIADDAAARRLGPRQVARTLATVAIAPRTQLIGAAGWPVWRVERQLHARPGSRARALLAVAVTGMFGMAALHVTLHALAGVHVVSLVRLLCLPFPWGPSH